MNWFKKWIIRRGLNAAKGVLHRIPDAAVRGIAQEIAKKNDYLNKIGINDETEVAVIYEILENSIDMLIEFIEKVKL